MSEFIETNSIVLRKTDYSESSLIVSVLTADYGKKSFILKGARRVKKNKTPTIDYFRLINLLYKEHASKSLCLIREAECIRDFYSITADLKKVNTGLWLCRFIEINVEENDPLPHTYNALLITFEKFSAPQKALNLLFAYYVGVILVFLKENGFINHDKLTHEMKSVNIFMEIFETEKIPELSAFDRKKILNWLFDFLKYFDMKVPSKPQLNF
ncbi:MAG: DNA repair protein RecO [Verrucomicrobiota bacterium]|nr:DNA repair protein RecO [Verrucomicrobiota bacterium]